MKGFQIALILIFYPILGFGQFINGINTDFGFSINTYKIQSIEGFSKTSDAGEVSLFINILGKKNINKKLSYDFGFGINRE